MQIQSTITKEIYNYEPNGQRSLCPECSSNRKKYQDKCLSWDNESNRGHCHHCLTSFYEYRPKKEYVYPEWSNKTELTDQAVKYFESRMISQNTLVKMRVYSDMHYMTQVNKEVEVICFPYFSDEKLINIKYRGFDKSFQVVKGAELIFWNIDCLKEANEVIIVEGEIDALTLIQAGFNNVLSVPNGAAKNLDYLHLEMFENIKKIYIAVDQDEPGLILKDELIHKLGPDRCWVVSFKDCKDANEYLQKYGDAIMDVITDAHREESEYDKLRTKLQIDPLAELTEPPACCYINGNPLTFGEISLWDGKLKSGKTFIIGAAVAAMLANKLIIGKIQGHLPPVRNMVLYFDTEQSSYHANRSIKRICKLIGEPNPPNLLAFGLRPLNATERLAFIEKTIHDTENLAVVVIDGARDLLAKGINDEPEATMIVSLFLKWTGEYNIHMPVILHQNKADVNARGHIGSELGNKAETVLSVTKDNSGLFIVSCPYSKDENFEDFAFTITDGIIASSEMPQEEKAISTNPQRIGDQTHFMVLDQIFKTSEKLQRSELTDAIIYGFDNTFKEFACRSFIKHYLYKGWISNMRDGMKTFYTYNRASN